MSLKPLYGIIGFPLGHSLSPLMHNTAFKELGVDAEYKLFPLKQEELGDFFVHLHEKSSDIFGLNVTIPYKEEVFKYMDKLSPFAQKVGAVNTIVISEDRRFTGFNTDGPGFLAHLAELKIDVQNKRIAILGAGGTTRAILAVLCLLPERPQSIRIFNRTKETLDILVLDLGQRLNVDIVEVVDKIEDLDIELADLLINTTSVGVKEEDPLMIDAELLHPHMLVYDVIYNPAETKLLRVAKAKGAKISNGLGMLFYQGVLSFQHWADAELDPDIKMKMRVSLMKGLRT